MKKFQITITSDNIESIAKFQNFLDCEADYILTQSINIDNDFEDSKEYSNYLKK